LESEFRAETKFVEVEPRTILIQRLIERCILERVKGRVALPIFVSLQYADTRPYQKIASCIQGKEPRCACAMVDEPTVLVTGRSREQDDSA
jgi:hypothetical protein